MNPRELPEKWQVEADAYESDGISCAKLLRRVADELASAFTEWDRETLTLHEAEAESGYSYTHLQRLVSEGEIPNAGEPGSPRIRRADMPRKCGRGRALRAKGRDIADEILARRPR